MNSVTMSKIILESTTIATMNAAYRNASQCACFVFCMGPIMEPEFQNERETSLHSGVKSLFLVTFIEASSSSLMDIKKGGPLSSQRSKEQLEETEIIVAGSSLF